VIPESIVRCEAASVGRRSMLLRLCLEAQIEGYQPSIKSEECGAEPPMVTSPSRDLPIEPMPSGARIDRRSVVALPPRLLDSEAL
jgi:hypothetical protein